MKSIKQIENTLPLTFKRASFSAGINNCKNLKNISVKYLNSKMITPQNFYKPISKLTFCATETK